MVTRENETIEVTRKKYQQWAEKVQSELQTQTKWMKLYEKYALDILMNSDNLKQGRKKFRVPSTMECYVTLGNSASGKMIYDLRYLGQSIGEIRVNGDDVELFVSKKKAETNKAFFGYSLGEISKEPWGVGKKAKEFRKYFNCIVSREKMPRQKEHMVETRLFKEFAKTVGGDKSIRYIQPIKFAGCFTHMKTAVKGSGAKDGLFAVSDKGGEIDVFCRRKVAATESRLTVVEVKDKSERNESFAEAMFQAISYAVFLRELIRTPYGAKWMKIWGMNCKIRKSFTINAAVAIPAEDSECPTFSGQKILLGEDIIELHYMVLDKVVLNPIGEVRVKTDI